LCVIEKIADNTSPWESPVALVVHKEKPRIWLSRGFAQRGFSSTRKTHDLIVIKSVKIRDVLQTKGTSFVVYFVDGLSECQPM